MNMRATQVSALNRPAVSNRGADTKYQSGGSGSSVLDQGSAYRENSASQGLADSAQQQAQENPSVFRTGLEQAFGGQADPTVLDSLVAMAENGELPLPANVRFVDAGTLGANATGAYDGADGGTVYLDRRLLSNPKELESVYTEELGHHLDNLLGGQNAANSDTLNTFSDVFADNIQTHTDTLFGGLTGLTPGINPGAGGAPGQLGTTGFGGPMFQPMSAIEFAASAVGGQAEVAQTGQAAEAVELQSPLLRPTEQAAYESIDKNLSQGLFTDVSKEDLQAINQTLRELEPLQKNNVIANLSDDKLETWGSEINGQRGSLSDSEKIDLYNSLASDLDATQLGRIYNSFGEDHHSGLMSAIRSNATPETHNRVAVTILAQAAETPKADKSLTTQALVASSALSDLQVAPAQPELLAMGFEGQLSLGKQELERLMQDPSANRGAIKTLEKQLDDLSAVAANVSEKLDNSAVPIRAMLVVEENSASVPLQLYAQPTGDNSWEIVDITNPENISTYRGEGATPKAGLEAAWQNFIDDNNLPEGQIAATPPSLLSDNASGFSGTTPLDAGDALWNQHSSGQSGFAAWSSGLGIGSLALAGLGVAALFSPAAGAAPWLFSASFGTGVASAGLNTVDRVQHDNFELLSTETALDVLSLVGGPIGKSGRYVKIARHTDVGAEVASGVIIAREHYLQFQEIKANPGLSESEKTEQIKDVMLSAVIQGGVMTVGHGLGNVAVRMNDAAQSVRMDVELPSAQVSVVHTVVNGKREIGVVHGSSASQAEIDIHTQVAKELAANQGVYGVAYRALMGEHNYKPNTRGEEVHFEVAKHEQLVSHFEVAVANGATDLQPKLDGFRNDLATNKAELAETRVNPDMANAPAHGQIDSRASNSELVTLKGNGTKAPSSSTSRDILQPNLQARYPDATLLGKNEPLVINGETVTNLNGPKVENFQSSPVNGRVFVDEKTGTVILSANVATGKGGTLLERIEIPYSQNAKGEWRADFSDHNLLTKSGLNFEIKVNPLNLEGKVESKGVMSSRHFKEANLQLSNLWSGDPDNSIKRALKPQVISLVNDGAKRSPGPFTWHHVDAEGNMQLVDRRIHELFKHKGGIGEIQDLQNGK